MSINKKLILPSADDRTKPGGRKWGIASQVLCLTILALPVLAAMHGVAHAAVGGSSSTPVTGGLGEQAATTSSDLGYGFGTGLEFASYAIAGIAAAYAGFTFWQHHKNPNGQHRMSYAFASVLAAGFMAGLPSMVGKSAETVTNGQATVTGQAQQLTYSNGNG